MASPDAQLTSNLMFDKVYCKICGEKFNLKVYDTGACRANYAVAYYYGNEDGTIQTFGSTTRAVSILKVNE